jgi:hypothetical protein
MKKFINFSRKINLRIATSVVSICNQISGTVDLFNFAKEQT